MSGRRTRTTEADSEGDWRQSTGPLCCLLNRHMLMTITPLFNSLKALPSATSCGDKLLHGGGVMLDAASHPALGFMCRYSRLVADSQHRWYSWCVVTDRWHHQNQRSRIPNV